MTKLSNTGYFLYKVIISVLLVIVVALLVVISLLIRGSRSEPVTVQHQNIGQFHLAYFLQEDFYTGILNPEKVDPIEEKVYGGIVSHHFFVERHIAKLFGTWSKQNYKTIVILGPNHFNAGKGDVIISKEPYKTTWGELEIELETVGKLISAGIAKNEENPFEREHSMSVLVGFIKNKFPEAKVVPVIIKHGTTKEKMQKLAEELNRILPEDSLVLASVDFSHHVNNQTAQNQDKQSIEAIKGFNTDLIWNFPPEQMDSPATIYALLKYLELKKARQMKYWNTNQALVSGNLDSQDVTSYVFASFMK